jgi:osmotically inducible protein OsmC
MAVDSKATTVWNDGLAHGAGTVSAASGSFELELTWAHRAESRAAGTSPEELIAAAHAGCFAMALSHALGQSGHEPQRLTTSATVGFQPGEGITAIHLSVVGLVPGLSSDEFGRVAEEAKGACPVSQALTGVPQLTLEATLES